MNEACPKVWTEVSLRLEGIFHDRDIWAKAVMGKGVHGWGVRPRSERSLSIDSEMAWQSQGMGSRPFGIEVYQFICPKTKDANKCALKIHTRAKKGNGSGPLAFPWCLLIILVGWSQDHGPPRRRETSLLFYSYGAEREENMEHLRRRRRGFRAGRFPFSPIRRRFRVPWPIRGSQNEDRLSFRTRRQMRLPRTCGA